MREWTSEQKQAISLRGLNLLVAAAAGSGKTAVLVERVIQLLLQDNADIDKMLVVTFTKAAAGEMRERISQALLEALHRPGPHLQHARRQLTRLNRASISTLHSFCTEVIRRYYHLVNIDPGFRVADQNEADLMQMEVLDSVMESAYAKAAPEFLGFIEMYASSKSDQAAREMLLQVYRFIQSQPYPWQWLQERVAAYAPDAAVLAASPWLQSILEATEVQVAAARARFARAITICQEPDGPAVYLEALQQDMQASEALLKAVPFGFEALSEAWIGVQHPRLRAQRGGNEELKTAVKRLRQEGKDLLKGPGQNLFSKSLSEWSRELNELYPYLQQLNHLLQAFVQEYQARKADKGLLDFNDLEHFALEILQDPVAAQEYRQHYQYIFVDEYQDSNLVQETLLSCIARPDNLFMVGDVKQSIYRFRLADPSLFLHKYRLYQDKSSVACRRVDLKTNFRSQAGIIAAVNHVFARIMNRHVGELDYDEKAFLYSGLKLPEAAAAPVKVTLIDKQPRPEEMDGEEDRGDAAREAAVVAAAIHSLLGESIYDAGAGGFRPLKYRDIVVLLRATRNWSAEFMEIFAEQGIPAYADMNSGYLGAVEVELILNLLKLIDNHNQDIPLLSVLRSPLFAMSSADLIAIRLKKSQGAFYEACNEYSRQTDDPLAERLREIKQQLQVWRREARYLPVDQLIWQILMESGYYYHNAALPGGLQRQANLRVLVERARQFEKSSLKGLFNFIKFIEKLIAQNADMEMARVLGENDDVVRVMSIHKSKGLEFPAVIVAGLGKDFNLSDSKGRVMLHKDLGIGTRYVNLTTRRYSDSIASIAVKNRLRLESLAEEMRILYVAMTRPQSRLHLIGTVKDLPRRVQLWNRPLGRYELSQARGFMDWLGPVLLQHPDGQVLRDYLETPCHQIEEHSEASWQLEVLSSNALLAEERRQQARQEELLLRLAAGQDSSMTTEQEELQRRLSWRYPYLTATRLPSKMTVSELKQATKDKAGMMVSIPALNKRPLFMSQEDQFIKAAPFTAAQRGTIMHHVMQQLDLEQVGDWAALQSQLDQMVEKQILTSAEAASVSVEKIAGFFRSELGQRILQARRVRREAGFNQLIPAGRLIAAAGAPDEALLLQGVIDLFFEEEDGLVVVDYKTDYVTAANRLELIEQYRLQVAAYCQALEAIEKQPVKAGYLYFFHSEEGVQVY